MPYTTVSLNSNVVAQLNKRVLTLFEAETQDEYGSHPAHSIVISGTSLDRMRGLLNGDYIPDEEREARHGQSL